MCIVSGTSRKQALEGKFCAILWRNVLGCMEDQQAEIAQFLEGTGQDHGSKNYGIPRGNLQLIYGSLIVETSQFPRGIGSQLLGS